ncbi:hypothetical protein [Bacteroides phage Versailles]|nr:MAG: hypothetical protein [Bacteroides phage NR01]WAK79110.1 hypothetical protein [Bacteroides phage Versailles]DAL76232.1 MAG TPA: hypothetical protein [Caudoviricetes sp.]
MAIVVGIKKTTKFQKQPSDNLLMPALCVGITLVWAVRCLVVPLNPRSNPTLSCVLQ